MPKVATTQFICSECGAIHSKWAGRCIECGTWNSLTETEVSPNAKRRTLNAKRLAPEKLAMIPGAATLRIPTGMADLDQILGGGLVPGSVVLLAGDPGIGKSTLALQLAAHLTGPVLYVSGEESAAQIRLRAERLGLPEADVELLAETDVDSVAGLLGQGGYNLVIIDSIQTMSTAALPNGTGSVAQVTASAQLLQTAAKSSDTAVLLIGHVTKEGTIAGPKILEHLVDVVLYLEGERYGSFKAMRGIKNRFGSTNEVAIFELGEQGLSAVANPSAALLAERQAEAGSAVLATMEGSRPVLVEVQALVAPTSFGYPRRTASGLDLNRLNLLVAVLTKRAGINLSNQDVYVNIVGGLKISEPAADLAIILSIASAHKNQPISADLVVFGEVGLSGEIRSVSQVEKRLREAKKLGFKRAVGPSYRAAEVIGNKRIDQAIRAALQP